MINTTFRFATIEGNEVSSSSFNLIPVNFPTIFSSYLAMGDPLTYSGSVQTLDVVDTVYKVELNLNDASTWYVNINANASTTASADIASGSYATGSICAVTFNLIDHVKLPSVIKSVTIDPVNSNVGFNEYFILADSVTKTTDNVGSLTVNLVPQAYDVSFKGGRKTTKFQILVPNQASANAKDILVSDSLVSNRITVKNQAILGYTAQAADARFVAKGGSIDSASYAVTASYALNGGTGGGATLTTGSTYPITASWSEWAPFSLTASYALSGDNNIVHTNTALHDNTMSVWNNADNLWYDVAPRIEFGEQDKLIFTPSSYSASPYSRALIESASFALTASYALNGGTGTGGTNLTTGSTYPITASWALNAATANTSTVAFTAINASTATNATNAVSASYVPDLYPHTFQASASWASQSLSASYTATSNTASYAVNAGYASSAYTAFAATTADGAITANTATSASYALTASYALNGGAVISGSSGTTLVTGSTYPITSSWATKATTATRLDAFSTIEDADSATLTFNSETLTFNEGTNQIESNQSLVAPSFRLSSAAEFSTGQIDFTGNADIISTNGKRFSFKPEETAACYIGDISSSVGFHGDLFGTASRATTASYALTGAGSGTTLDTGSTYPITASWAESASWAPGGTGGTTLYTGSTYEITSSWAISASWAPGGTSGGTTLYTGSTYPITSSWAVSASWAPGGTGGGTTLYTGSTYEITSSWALNAFTASTYVNQVTQSTTASYFYSQSGSGAWKMHVDMSSGDLVFQFS